MVKGPSWDQGIVLDQGPSEGIESDQERVALVWKTRDSEGQTKEYPGKMS